MIKFMAGWMLFFVILFSFLIPTLLLISGEIPVKCWKEKRYHPVDFKPAYKFVTVCK